jgi:hypothetical protein
MITVRLSTEFATDFKVGTKKYVAFLRRPDLIEVYGSGIESAKPMYIKFANSEKETDWDFAEEFFKAELKFYKKSLKQK